MRQTTNIRQHHASKHIDTLITKAYELGIGNAVSQTVAGAAQAPKPYDHIMVSEAEKFLSRYSETLKSNTDFGRTLMLTGFGFRYKHGIQFRGMMTALNDRPSTVEALQRYNYEPTLRVDLIQAYRQLACPPISCLEGKPVAEFDCSRAISEPNFRLSASGYYITQLATLLNSAEVKSARDGRQDTVVLDRALLQFAKQFVKYERKANLQMVTCSTYGSLAGIVSQHASETFKATVPLIAQSVMQNNFEAAHKSILAEGKRKADTPLHYIDALRTYVKKTELPVVEVTVISAA